MLYIKINVEITIMMPVVGLCQDEKLGERDRVYLAQGKISQQVRLEL
jgi:hypothetical protein